MLTSDLEILPRQSGKTASLKLKAIELHNQYKKVYYIDFSINSHKQTKRYFSDLKLNIECLPLSGFNHRYCKEITEMPPEYRLIYSSGIHIIVYEYALFDQDKFSELIHNLKNSKDQFYMYGKSSIYT